MYCLRMQPAPAWAAAVGAPHERAVGLATYRIGPIRWGQAHREEARIVRLVAQVMTQALRHRPL